MSTKAKFLLLGLGVLTTRPPTTIVKSLVTEPLRRILEALRGEGLRRVDFFAQTLCAGRVCTESISSRRGSAQGGSAQSRFLRAEALREEGLRRVDFFAQRLCAGRVCAESISSRRGSTQGGSAQDNLSAQRLRAEPLRRIDQSCAEPLSLCAGSLCADLALTLLRRGSARSR